MVKNPGASNSRRLNNLKYEGASRGINSRTPEKVMALAIACAYNVGRPGNKKHNTFILNEIFKICMQVKCVKCKR